jgi:curved DNA-binding protein CbpA
MKTLYDLLGARPDDDAEALRAAFRKAAKANHPDLHAGEPDAAVRFRQIAEAYEILRDAAQRATYDRLLQFERERLSWTLKSTVSYLMQSIVSDAVTAVGLAIILVGGYMTYAHFSKLPAEELASTPARGAARIAAAQPAAPTNGNKPSELRDRLERATDRAPEAATGGPVPKAAALNSDVAKVTNAFVVTVDQAGPRSGVERPDPSAGTEKLNQDSAQLVKALSSSGESDIVGKSSLSDFAMSDDKRDVKRRGTRDIYTNDAKISNMKLPETKVLGRARVAVKPQATSRTNFEQASLENRNTCSDSQSCSRDVPPLFGVGF